MYCIIISMTKVIIKNSKCFVALQTASMPQLNSRNLIFIISTIVTDVYTRLILISPFLLVMTLYERRSFSFPPRSLYTLSFLYFHQSFEKGKNSHSRTTIEKSPITRLPTRRDIASASTIFSCTRTRIVTVR